MKITLAAPAGQAGADPALARLGTAWRVLLRHFNQRNTRERVLLAGAAAAVLLMLADLAWLGPALKDFKEARAALAGAQQAQQALQDEITQAETRGVAHAQQQRAELAQWRARLRDGDAALRSHEASLVGPDRMVDLLEQLLGRHGEVQVRTLRSLGRSDLLGAAPAATTAAATLPAATAAAAIAAAAAASGGHAAAAAAQAAVQANNNAATVPATTATSGGGLYRHGVELVLEGSYADLLGYLKAMEALPQRVLWGSASLKVGQHPRTTLTLRVYTLSRDPNWLEL